MRGTPSTSATVLTAKFVCSGVCLYRLLRMTSAGASFLSSMTSRVLPPADSSLTSAMPSMVRDSTRSLILLAVAAIDVWYGISVTTMRSRWRPVPSTMSVLARSRIEPLPVR